MTITNRLAALVLVAVLAPVASAEAALCGGDSWGGRGAGIDSNGAGSLSVTITAVTNLLHLSGHPFFHGDFFAKAKLVSGFGPACESNTNTTHHTTLGEGTLAMAQRTCSGLNYDSFYYGGGIHWGFDTAEHFTQSASSVYFPSPCDCDSSPDCCVNECQGTWDPMLFECNRGSPILIDLGSNATVFHLTSPQDGVWFDIKARGVARRVAWTRAERQVAFLALDRNGNGVIDDGSELFGTATPINGERCAANGFLALREFDTNNDGRIDADDPIYPSLRLWIDINHNGVSEPNELKTLPEADVKAIFTAYGETKRFDRHGNWYRYEGVALVTTRGGQEVARRVYDVFLTMLLP